MIKCWTNQMYNKSKQSHVYPCCWWWAALCTPSHGVAAQTCPYITGERIFQASRCITVFRVKLYGSHPGPERQTLGSMFHFRPLCVVLSISNVCPLKAFLCFWCGLGAGLIWALSSNAEWGSWTPTLVTFTALLVWPWAGTDPSEVFTFLKWGQACLPGTPVRV